MAAGPSTAPRAGRDGSRGDLVVLAFDAGLVRIPAGTTREAESVVAEYGLLALFGLFVVEGAMLLYFVPSESLVPAAIFPLAESVGDAAAVVGVAVLGATVGQVALFVVARRGGRDWVLRRDRFPVSADALDRFDGWFERWGPLVVP